MLILLGGRSFLAGHVRLALGDEERVIVGARPPSRPALLSCEYFLDHAAFAGEEGAAALERAQGVVYFASATTPGDPTSDLASEVERNVAPAAALLARLHRLGSQARFVFLSSGGTVYGRDVGAALIPEEHPLAPISPYGLGKVMIEDAVRFAGRAHRRSFAILRVANPVGAFAHSTMQGLVPAALRAVRSGAPMPMYGDGCAERDYLAAADVADAVVAAARAHDFPEATWNVGSGRGLTILDVFRTVEEAIGRPVPFDRRPARAVDVPRVVLDVTRIGADLGWRARHDLCAAILEIWREHV